MILPGEGKEKLFMIVVVGVQSRDCFAEHGQAKIYGSYVNIREVEELKMTKEKSHSEMSIPSQLRKRKHTFRKS